MNLESDNANFTAVEGVLHSFRRRLTPQQAVDFSQILPAVLRALFVANWRLDEGRTPHGDRDDWTGEAKALRPHHSLTPDNCVAATALALRRSVILADFEKALAHLPAFAIEFSDVPGVNTMALGHRIVLQRLKLAAKPSNIQICRPPHS